MANQQGPDAPPDLVEALENALERLNMRRDGDFDGLLGEFPETVSVAVQDIRTYVRDYLLDRHDEITVRKMLSDFSAPKPHLWPASDGDELALGILYILGQALQITPEEYFIFLAGKDGLSGAKQRESGAMGGRNKSKGPNAARKRDAILREADKFDLTAPGTAAKIAKRVGCTARYVRKTLKEEKRNRPA